MLQRVREASVSVGDTERARIGHGMLVLLGVRQEDTEARARRLAERVCGYRLFNDEAGRMNLDVRDVQGAVLVVPQFTLAADTRRGRRPGFSTAAPPAEAEPLVEAFLWAIESTGIPVSRGVFGADMQVSLINDGPVTLWIEA